ncbi:hypothetical protein [Amycolatopsis sp. cmx-4-54]
MAQEQSGMQAPDSGLLLEVEMIPTAADRGKANGAAADNDGNDG